MSLLITPGVGGNVALPGVGATGTATSPSSSPIVAPSYQIDFAGLSRATTVGLSQPTSVGDLEILFAQISTALKQSLETLATVEDEGKAERFRGQLGQALASFDQMIRWGDTLDVNRENIKVQQAIENDQTKLRDDARTEKTRLEGLRGPLQQKYDQNVRTISGLQSTNGTLNQESITLNNQLTPLLSQRTSLINQRNGLQLPAQQSTYNNLTTQIDNLTNQITPIQNRLGVIPGLISQNNQTISNLSAENIGLKNQIDTLSTSVQAEQRKIDAAQQKIDAAVTSRKLSESIRDSMIQLMGNFVLETIPLALLALGNTKSEMGRDAAGIVLQTGSFDELLSAMARAFAQIGTTLAEAQLGADVAVNTSGAGLNQTQSTPDRFGQLSAPIARAIAFAGMIAAVLGPVADMLGGLGRGLGMQTAGSMAGAGEPRVRLGL